MVENGGETMGIFSRENIYFVILAVVIVLDVVGSSTILILIGVVRFKVMILSLFSYNKYFSCF